VIAAWFGIGWLDAILRLQLLVGFMTVNALLLIWAERKVLGRVQQRMGPTRTGPSGLLQSVADGAKLLLKEDVKPSTADRWVFNFAPFALFVPIFVSFLALPYSENVWVRALPLGLFFVVAIQSVSIVGMLMAGWGSDSKYALLGSARAVAQMISYEIPLVLAVVLPAMVAQSLDFRVIIEAQASVPFLVVQPLAFFVFFVAAMAELARNPFDIPVAESEVVGGPFVEYSGIRWSMFFLGEYTNLFIMALLGAVLFLGGYAWPFGLLGIEVHWVIQAMVTMAKVTLLILVFMWVRGSMPRLRIDQLMNFAWKVLLELIFIQIFVTGLILVYDPPLTWLWLSVTSGLLLVATFEIVRRGVRRTGRSPREERLARLRARAARGA
jgi:NADH-quinone oxidoreductase subunit H